MLVVQHLQLVLGYRPFLAALWMIPVVAAVGFGLLTQLRADDTVAAILTGYGVLGFGLGMGITLAYNLVMATAPPQKAGAAAALNETGTELGGALGIAVLGSIASAV